MLTQSRFSVKPRESKATQRESQCEPMEYSWVHEGRVGAGHVNFILFEQFFLTLGCQRERVFLWNTGLNSITVCGRRADVRTRSLVSFPAEAKNCGHSGAAISFCSLGFLKYFFYFFTFYEIKVGLLFVWDFFFFFFLGGGEG